MNLNEIKQYHSTIPSVLVIGASGGIGGCIMERFVEKGWAVLATARNWNEFVAVSSQHSLDRRACKRFSLDVRFEKNWQKFSSLLKKNGSIFDAVVYSVGSNPKAAIPQTTPPELENAFTTKVIGFLLLSQYIIPYLREGSKVIALSGNTSGETLKGTSNCINAALEALINTASVQYPKISFYALAPGLTATKRFFSNFTADQKCQNELQAIFNSVLKLANATAVQTPEQIAECIESIIISHLPLPRKIEPGIGQLKNFNDYRLYLQESSRNEKHN